MDGRLAWPVWLTHSGQLKHKVAICQPHIRRMLGEVSELKQTRDNVRLSGVVVVGGRLASPVRTPTSKTTERLAQ